MAHSVFSSFSRSYCYAVCGSDNCAALDHPACSGSEGCTAVSVRLFVCQTDRWTVGRTDDITMPIAEQYDWLKY